MVPKYQWDEPYPLSLSPLYTVFVASSFQWTHSLETYLRPPISHGFLLYLVAFSTRFADHPRLPFFLTDRKSVV